MTDDIRTYDLHTTKGAASAIVQAIVGIIALVMGAVDYDAHGMNGVNVAVLLVSGVVLVSFSVVWLLSLWAYSNERRREEAEIRAITPEVRRAELAVRLAKEYLEITREIDRIAPEKLRYLPHIGAPEIDLLPKRGMFLVIQGGERVPYDIVIELAEAWMDAAKRYPESVAWLPPVRSWSDGPTRNYVRAIYKQLIDDRLLVEWRGNETVSLNTGVRPADILAWLRIDDVYALDEFEDEPEDDDIEEAPPVVSVGERGYHP